MYELRGVDGMNPFERWDDWEWEKAAQELGRERGTKYQDWPVKRNTPKKSKRELLYTWTGTQKKAALSVAFFLLLFSPRKEKTFFLNPSMTFIKERSKMGICMS